MAIRSELWPVRCGTMNGNNVQSRLWPLRFGADALHDLRTTNSHLSNTSRGGKSGLAIRSSMTAIAILPISRHGWCSVVSGTGNRRAYFTSSMPTMRDVLGDTLTERYQRVHQISCRQIIRANEGIRTILLQYRLDELRIAGISDT